MENEWELIHKIGKANFIDQGDDSSVLSIETKNGTKFTVKEYDRPRFIVPPKYHERILKEYYGDTQKAANILKANPNPLNQFIQVGDKLLPLEYKIIPQGGMLLSRTKEITPYSDGLSGETKEGLYKTSIGQEFIEGLTLSSLKKGRKPGTYREALAFHKQEGLEENSVILSRIENYTISLFAYLSKEVDSYLTYSPINIKPFIDDQEKEVVLVLITDLASSFSNYYLKTSRFSELRKNA